MSATLITIGGVILTFVTLLFVLSILLKRNDIADVAWGVGIALVAFTAYVIAPLHSSLVLLMLILIVVWAMRLSTRIFGRFLRKSEDYRYKRWRDSWGAWFYPRSYLQVFLLQGFLMIVVGYSIVHASVFVTDSSIGTLGVIGSLLWLVGFVFEAVADRQLDQFLENPDNQGHVIDTGLWRYSRHPNYFGEVVMWWGLWVMMAGTPLGLVALISPITITLLILFVSGVPLLEKKFAGNPEFEAYKLRTSVFIPLPPKSQKGMTSENVV